jgi:hypothetical protein
MKHLLSSASLKSLFAAALVALLGTAQVHAQVPAALEGNIVSITRNATTGVATMNVVGVPVRVTTTTPIKTPTATLTTAQLASTVLLPGRTQGGFIGGTAIINGTWNATANRIDATDVFVEPAENLLLGYVTAAANAAGEISINGVRVVPIPTTELRMPALPMRNEVGIAVVPSSVPVGAQAAASGYYAGGVFNAFIIDVSAGTPVSSTPQVTILLAQGRERTPNASRGDELDIRGGATTAHANGANQTIRIFRIDTINGVRTETLIGQTTTIPDVIPGMATWRFTVATPPSADAVLGTCPTRIRAVNVSVTTSVVAAESPVEVVIK